MLSACTSASPEQLRTQATIAAAQSNGYAREARAMEATAQAQAIERARVLATATALAVTPSATPAPTLTPLPSATPEPLPSATRAPTLTPIVIVLAVTSEPTATAQAIATPEPTAQAPARARTIYDDWPILLLLGLGALALVVILSRLADGKTITLPGRGEK